MSLTLHVIYRIMLWFIVLCKILEFKGMHLSGFLTIRHVWRSIIFA